MNRDRDRDQNPERLAAAERYPDADTFGSRVQGHDPDQHQSFERVFASQAAQLDPAMSFKQPRAESDEQNSQHQPDHRTWTAIDYPFEHQSAARRCHESRGRGVGYSEIKTCVRSEEKKWERAQARGQRGEQRSYEDRQRLDRHSSSRVEP